MFGFKYVNYNIERNDIFKQVILHFSILFNLSKFFEVTCLYHPVGGYDTSGNNSTDIPLNITSTDYSDICQPQVLTIV